jgi:hypothetical protein
MDVQIIKCLDVPYESLREQKFMDLRLIYHDCKFCFFSLTVKGHKNLIASLENYTRKEILDDDNKYKLDNGEYHKAEKVYKKFIYIFFLW